MRPHTFGTRALRALFVPFALAALAAGCETETPPIDPNGDSGFAPAVDGSLPPYDGSSQWPNPADEGGVILDPNDPTPALPAEVCGVLNKHGCTSCHSQPVQPGVPMPLTQRSHFQGNARTGTPMPQEIVARIQDKARPMPPISSARDMLPAADVAVIKNWIDTGMQGVAGAECKPTASPGTDGGVPVEQGVTWGSRGWPTDEKAECDYILTLGAHEVAGTPVAQDDKPFMVPAKDTHYHCFYEKAPWGTEHVQAIAMRARIETPEDKEMVHHLVISGQKLLDLGFGAEKPAGPGDHKPCLNPNGATMNVWAPGYPNPSTYPQDVGLKLPSGDDAYIELQVHYNRPGVGGLLGPGGARPSKVRYDICVTKKLKPNEAGIFWLGYDNAFIETLGGGRESRPLDNQGNGVAMGRCTANNKGRILSIMPHMHERGMHGKFEIVKNGVAKTIVDKPFSFEDQTAYFQENLWIEQGEYVRTTCRWKGSEPIRFGFGSQDEMCYFYTLAYPVETFKKFPTFPIPGERGFVGGDMACAGAAGP